MLNLVCYLGFTLKYYYKKQNMGIRFHTLLNMDDIQGCTCTGLSTSAFENVLNKSLIKYI